MKSKRTEMDSRVMIPASYFAMDKYDAVQVIGYINKYMTEKASKAFCAVHCPKGCPYDDSDGCGALREFKRKMEE